LRVFRLPKLRCTTGLKARLLLEDGTAIEGCGFGYPGTNVGEVVFSTSMTGYPESLTDPSYRGQILVYTHPMVGNYGVPDPRHALYALPLDYESNRVHVTGFIIAELPEPSHSLLYLDLNEWLRINNIPGMYKADTRFLVKKIREHGVLTGVLKVYYEEESVEWEELEERLRTSVPYDKLNLAYEVSPLKPVIHEPTDNKIVGNISILDCGVKYGILRILLKNGFRITRFPCWSKPEVLVEDSNGVVLSNGPGNPSNLVDVVRNVKALIEYNTPILGICLGMQLLALASGARIYKLKYGHRGPNKPVVEANTGRCYITTQNHGYAVDPSSLKNTGLKTWFVNADDSSLEGVRNENGVIMATQFHPEGGPGPHDTAWVFNYYKKKVLKNGL